MSTGERSEGPNSTVSQSHAAISHPNSEGWATAVAVVSTAPTSVTNITGLRHSVRGSSLRSASGSVVISCRGSSTPAATR
ncbi:hypothetical protein [Nocardia lijiangensis]|uniref:hypothetical protein n=1 Tax=Nocardia lijiangensis TaxID=299618 RepID=UPI000A043E79|nr:hypothetical protein [Nocardia lijiangensis]